MAAHAAGKDGAGRLCVENEREREVGEGEEKREERKVGSGWSLGPLNRLKIDG